MPNNSSLSSTQNGWNEYSRLVLKELETLSQGITNLNMEIQDIKREIALIKDREDKVDELREWKDKINETITPTQLAQLMADVQDLKNFKTKALTVWVIVQFIVSILSIFRDKIF